MSIKPGDIVKEKLGDKKWVVVRYATKKVYGSLGFKFVTDYDRAICTRHRPRICR